MTYLAKLKDVKKKMEKADEHYKIEFENLHKKANSIRSKIEESKEKTKRRRIL